MSVLGGNRSVPPIVVRFLNAATLLAVLWMNGLAASGAIGGQTIGELANRHASTFLPADYVFGIWSVIYAGLIAFVVFQALPAGRRNDAVERIDLWWVVNGLLNIAWIVTFSFGLFGPALLAMAALFGSLVIIYGRIGVGSRRLDLPTRAFVGLPFSLYLAWILVALIANSFQYAASLGWAPATSAGWSAGSMAVATVIASLMALRRGDWVFPCVTAWAFLGIAARYPEGGLIVTVAYTCTVLGLAAMVAGLAVRRRSVPLVSGTTARPVQ